MKLDAQKHIDNSKRDLEIILSETRDLLNELSDSELNIPEGAGKWSVLQCLKHLSFATKVYVDNTRAIFTKKSPSSQSQYDFKSSWKGDQFTKMISPKDNGDIKGKMKTFKSMDPIELLNKEETINEFLAIHEEYLKLIEESKNYNLNKTKVATALGPIVKLRLGDSFRFIIGHCQRHLLQMKRIKMAIQS